MRKLSLASSSLPPSGDDYYPCGVPYWDSKEFFQKGGEFSESWGNYISTEAYLPDFEQWLPRKWHYRGDPPSPVIMPDMLPSSVWEDNLRSKLSEAEWGRLRKFCYTAAGGRCIACGSPGEPHLEAHEAWKFHDESGIQELVGLHCLCPTCHKIKHLGFANRLGILPRVYDRLFWLNDWTQADLELALKKVQATTEERSKRAWRLDLTFLTRYGVR